MFGQCALPVLLSPALWMSLLLPQEVRMITHVLLQTLFRFRFVANCIVIVGQLAPSTDVDLCGQASQLGIGNQGTMGCCLQSFCQVFSVVRRMAWFSECDGVRVKDVPSAVQDID